MTNGLSTTASGDADLKSVQDQIHQKSDGSTQKTVLEQFGILLKSEEGYRKYPYKDSLGILTVGIGRNLVTDGISEDEAMMLLANDVERSYQQCEGVFGFFGELEDARKFVLVSMCFQLGLRGLLAFRKMLAAIAKMDWSEAAIELKDSKYAEQCPRRVARLQWMLVNGKFSVPPELA